jgi:hypothetical protein
VRTATDEVIHQERKITPDRGAAPSEFLHTQNTIQDHIASDQVSFAISIGSWMGLAQNGVLTRAQCALSHTKNVCDNT